jgi:hypothetical protein
MLILLFIFPLALIAGSSQEKYPPVKLKFINNSKFPVAIHFYLQKTLIKAHFLKSGKSHETEAGHTVEIQLEYSPEPYKTILKAIDSEVEKARTITFSNDGEHIRIKEKFTYKKNVKIKPQKKKKKKPDKKEDDK